VDAQHGLNRERRPASLGAWAVRLDQRYQLVHGTTLSISSKNSRLRVFLVLRSKGRLDCFTVLIVLPHGPVRYSDRHGVLQTIP